MTPLISNIEAVSLDEDQLWIIARWALKTAMVFEFTGKSERFYTFAERDSIRNDEFAPSLSRTDMWICRYDGLHRALAHSARIEIGMNTGDNVIPVKAFTSCVSVGHFLFQILTVRVPVGIGGTVVFSIDEKWRSRTNQIWPIRGGAIWPPQDVINDDSYDELLHRFDRGPIVLRA